MSRTLVIGIVNVTPDSFSDGGRFHDGTRPDTQAAVAHGLALVEQGADLVDVGGESTRPGATRIPESEELARVLPVVEQLAEAGVGVSVDTMRSSVAARCVSAGASWVNDISGGLADPEMLDVAAELGCGYIAMHWRAHSALMAEHATYGDVVSEVVSEVAARREAALSAGIPADRLVLDPGIGFAKTGDHNWTLLAHLDELFSLGQPLLFGVSRKRFLGDLLATQAGPRPPRERDDATIALTTLLARRGVWGVRTHSVRAHADAVAVVERLRAEGEQ